MKFVRTLAPLAVLSACATAQPTDIPDCYQGPCIGIGEVQDLGHIQVKPLAVLEDSRCPIEADCVWEGRLRLQTELTLGHEVITAELTAWDGFTINGGTLTLAEVAPDASVQWPNLREEDYSFRFSFAD